MRSLPHEWLWNFASCTVPFAWVFYLPSSRNVKNRFLDPHEPSTQFRTVLFDPAFRPSYMLVWWWTLCSPLVEVTNPLCFGSGVLLSPRNAQKLLTYPTQAGLKPVHSEVWDHFLRHLPCAEEPVEEQSGSGTFWPRSIQSKIIKAEHGLVPPFNQTLNAKRGRIHALLRHASLSRSRQNIPDLPPFPTVFSLHRSNTGLPLLQSYEAY